VKRVGFKEILAKYGLISFLHNKEIKKAKARQITLLKPKQQYFRIQLKAKSKIGPILTTPKIFHLYFYAGN